MKTIRVSFVHNTPDFAIARFLKKIPKDFKVDVVPDAKVLIATTHLFLQNVASAARQSFLKQCHEKVTILDNAEEACAPDWNLFDYCIGQYDPSMISDRYLCGFDFLDEYQQVYNHHRAPIAKQHFCNFIYSNSGGHPYREKLFNIVSHYKSVHSLGTFLHNYDGDGMNCRNEKGKNNAWYFSGVDLRKPYKFTIAAENACFRGYTSEKIALAYLSDSVPIYWGDPLIENIYNPESFINANNLTEEELIERVRILDNNQKELENMLHIPAILSHQYETRMQHVNESADKLIRILLQPEQVKGAGSYMRLYLNSLIPQKPGLKMLLKELKQEVQNRILNTNAVKHRS